MLFDTNSIRGSNSVDCVRVRVRVRPSRGLSSLRAGCGGIGLAERPARLQDTIGIRVRVRVRVRVRAERPARLQDTVDTVGVRIMARVRVMARVRKL